MNREWSVRQTVEMTACRIANTHGNPVDLDQMDPALEAILDKLTSTDLRVKLIDDEGHSWATGYIETYSTRGQTHYAIRNRKSSGRKYKINHKHVHRITESRKPYAELYVKDSARPTANPYSRLMRSGTQYTSHTVECIDAMPINYLAVIGVVAAGLLTDFVRANPGYRVGEAMPHAPRTIMSIAQDLAAYMERAGYARAVAEHAIAATGGFLHTQTSITVDQSLGLSDKVKEVAMRWALDAYTYMVDTGVDCFLEDLSIAVTTSYDNSYYKRHGFRSFLVVSWPGEKESKPFDVEQHLESVLQDTEFAHPMPLTEKHLETMRTKKVYGRAWLYDPASGIAFRLHPNGGQCPEPVPPETASLSRQEADEQDERFYAGCEWWERLGKHVHKLVTEHDRTDRIGGWPLPVTPKVALLSLNINKENEARQACEAIAKSVTEAASQAGTQRDTVSMGFCISHDIYGAQHAFTHVLVNSEQLDNEQYARMTQHGQQGVIRYHAPDPGSGSSDGGSSDSE
jgi:hypothetical protein